MEALISQNALVFYLLTCVGIVAHACKKWIWREIDYSVWAYLFKVDIHATAATFATALAGTVTMISTGTITDYHITSQALLVMTTAFGIDASVLPATANAKARSGKEVSDGTAAKP
jgi:ABC-type transport system involved in cytochrome c biogenesis permease component